MIGGREDIFDADDLLDVDEEFVSHFLAVIG